MQKRRQLNKQKLQYKTIKIINKVDGYVSLRNRNKKVYPGVPRMLLTIILLKFGNYFSTTIVFTIGLLLITFPGNQVRYILHV